MESAARPCLDGLPRQVHMTFLSQAEPRPLVKRMASCGRNREEKETVWNGVLLFGRRRLCKGRGARVCAHTGQLVLRV